MLLGKWAGLVMVLLEVELADLVRPLLALGCVGLMALLLPGCVGLMVLLVPGYVGVMTLLLPGCMGLMTLLLPGCMGLMTLLLRPVLHHRRCLSFGFCDLGWVTEWTLLWWPRVAK